jgi:antitoxin component YwqK of YwqJK toxin-antitoxin module
MKIKILMTIKPIKNCFINIFIAFTLNIILFSCTSVKKEYDMDGHLLHRFEYSLLTKKLHGKYETYYEDGSYSSIDHYCNGKLNGISESYFINGKLRVKVEYKKDRLWNILAYNTISDDSLNYGNLVNGEGYLFIYNKQGDLRSEGPVTNGLRNGIWKYYSNAGLSDTESFKNGIRYGNNYISVIYL